MLTHCLTFLLGRPALVCEVGLALVYLWLALLVRREWPHAAAYLVAAMLALALAACTVFAR